MASRQELDFKAKNKFRVSNTKTKCCSKCVRFEKYNLDIPRTNEIRKVMLCHAITDKDIIKLKNQIIVPLTFNTRAECVCNKFRSV